VTKALGEQSQAMREITSSSENVSKQMKLIVGANREHSAGAESVLQMLGAIRQITDRNREGVTLTTVETAGPQEQAVQISALIDDLTAQFGDTFKPASEKKDLTSGGRSGSTNGSAD
jgi:methyl-accepting chemotaxis protein